MNIVTRLSLYNSWEQRECLSFHVWVYLSRAGTCVFWGLCLTDSDVAFFLPAFFLVPVSLLLHLAPLLSYSSRFQLHAAIQTTSGTMTWRIKDTGFSWLMMNCSCLTLKTKPTTINSNQSETITGSAGQLEQLQSFRSVKKGENEKPWLLFWGFESRR